MGRLKPLSTKQAQPHTNRQQAIAFPDTQDLVPFMLENQHFKNPNASL